MTSSRARHARAAAILAATALVTTSCGWRGLNSLPLPGTQGTGAGAYRVYIQMPDVTTLTPNSPVIVNDATVGTVSNIDVQDWHALVTVSLNKGVQLPANVVAKIGQTSLLGSTHLELDPPTDQAPEGRLRSGDTIPLARAGVYPTTEQTLSALSVVLNGGGFASLGDITKELDTALAGRTDTARDLLTRLTALTTGLDAQREDINTALAGLDRLGTVFQHQDDTIAAALDKVPPALTVLVDQRQHITDALEALGKLSDTASQIVNSSGDNLKANLHSLVPVLKQLAATGSHLTSVLSILVAFPFPLHTYKHVIKGDYLNLMITYDITTKRLDDNFLTGTPAGGAAGGVQSQNRRDLATDPPAPAPAGAVKMVNPLLGPLNLPQLLPPPPPAPAPRGDK